MPRTARKNIISSFIHVMVQGVNKDYIFDDKKHLKYYLKSVKSESKFKEFDLIAYCMMNNHAHLLFYVRDINAFSKFMKSVNQNFATYYNKSIDRVGTVFRNRYQLEEIQDYQHLINCIKYIHNNPVKAGMVHDCIDYQYSSYHDYLYKQGCAKYEILKEVFGKDANYLEKIENAYDKRFIDVDSNNSLDEYFEDGIRSFKNEFKYSLLDIFSKRSVLIKLIIYLKKDFNLKYQETLKYFDLPRGVINDMK